MSEVAIQAIALGRRFEVDTSRPLGTLSGGDQRRVTVILALAARPDIVILDEPAAGHLYGARGSHI